MLCYQSSSDRGARIVEMFKQGAYEPVPVEIQTAIMWGMQNDFFDSISVDDITRGSFKPQGISLFSG